MIVIATGVCHVYYFNPVLVLLEISVIGIQ